MSAVSASAARIAQKYVSPILRRLNDRAIWWQLGHFPIRSGEAITSVRIGGRLVRLSLPVGETSQQQWELNHLYRDDPYRLATLPRDVTTVLDIGGNVGLFSILARHYFPYAAIHAYEPSPQTFGLLQQNSRGLDIEIYQEGVAASDGRADLVDRGLSLYNQVATSTDGAIEVTSIRRAMDRLGATVDLLKLDCEGSEWGILSDTTSLRRAKHIAMEYHLGGPDCLSLWELVRLLKDASFAIQSLTESDNGVVGQLTAVNLTFAANACNPAAGMPQ